MRRLWGPSAALTCLLAVGAGCSDAGPEGAVGRAAGGRGTTPTTVPGPAPGISFAVASFDVKAAADPIPGGVDGAKAGIESTLNRWLAEGVLQPLRTGQPAGDLAAVFTAVGRERLATTPERSAFVDEGLPPAKDVRAAAASLAMVALADPDGNIPIVTVHVDLKLEGTVEGTPITVEHTGDVVMLPDGDAWRIDGWDIRATRDTASGPTTSTAKS